MGYPCLVLAERGRSSSGRAAFPQFTFPVQIQSAATDFQLELAEIAATVESGPHRPSTGRLPLALFPKGR